MILKHAKWLVLNRPLLAGFEVPGDRVLLTNRQRNRARLLRPVLMRDDPKIRVPSASIHILHKFAARRVHGVLQEFPQENESLAIKAFAEQFVEDFLVVEVEVVWTFSKKVQLRLDAIEYVSDTAPEK